MEIRCERLLLRSMTEADAEDLHAYRSLPDVCRYLPFLPMTREVVLQRLATDMGAVEVTGDTRALFLGVDLGGRVIGDVCLIFTARQHRSAEIGWVLAPDATGHGYATEAVRGLVAAAFGTLGLRRLVARMDARNTASARLAARVGMRLEAHLVQNEMFKGEWTDELDYALLASELARPMQEGETRTQTDGPTLRT